MSDRVEESERVESVALMLSQMGYSEAHDHFRVCAVCMDLFEEGRPDGQPQRCLCRRDDERRWPGFDFNERATLCYCCAQHVLPSGSKWSVWFCVDCKPRILRFNETMGSSVVPLGRHSLMANVGLGPRAISHEAQIEQFREGFSSLMDRIEALGRWKLEMQMPFLFSGLALQRESDPELRTWLLAVDVARRQDPELGKAAAFDRLAAYFAEA